MRLSFQMVYRVGATRYLSYLNLELIVFLGET